MVKLREVKEIVIFVLTCVNVTTQTCNKSGTGVKIFKNPNITEQ